MADAEQPEQPEQPEHPAPSSLGSGDTIGRYTIDDLITPGEPILARCRKTEEPDTNYLLKALPMTGENIETLRREVATLRMLDHPVIPRLIDFGLTRQRGIVWLVTEDYDADTLAQRLQTDKLPWTTACAVFLQIANALAHCHAHGLVHHDVTPDKILMAEDGSARLVGFELAVTDAEILKRAVIPSGDLAYVAPEVLEDSVLLGPRTDLYALGVVFYEAITGQPAFPAAFVSGQDLTDQLKDWKAESKPLDCGELAPVWLNHLIRKATDPNHRKRLPDTESFIGWVDAARASWHARAPQDVPELLQTPIGGPPRFEMAQPSLATPNPEIMELLRRVAAERRAQPPAPPPLLLLHGAAAAGGFVAATAFSTLVILLIELSTLNGS